MQVSLPKKGPAHHETGAVAPVRRWVMRVLIVGAGVAGLTLAGLLARQGHEPVLIDKRPDAAAAGYAIALWPQGTRVLHAVGAYDAFVARSEPMRRYRLNDGRGQAIGSYDAQELTARFDPVGCVERAALLQMLGASSGVELRHGLSVERLSQADAHVDAELSDGSHERCDLIIGADGMHSRVRELLFGRLAERDTGWGCFVWWGDAALVDPGETSESWGAGSFLGLYPCRDRVCVIAGAPVDVLQPERPAGRSDRLRRLLAPLGAPLDALLDRLPRDSEALYLWRMSDVRAPRWVHGRVALVGDAAAGFLPTAGIGASMALESAAVLADELSRSDAAHLPNALALYVKRRCPRVLAAQDQSRWLARAVFVRSPLLVALRNRALRHVSLRRMAGPIYRQMTTPI